MKPSLRILRASPRGFCAGVVRAIETVEAALHEYGPPVYARHAIVHNPDVLASFERRGVIFVEELDEVPDDAIVIFSAHGVACRVTAEARERLLTAIDATCPLVSKVHSEVRHHVAAGRDVLLIGHPGHPEVVGTVGQVGRGRVHVVPDRQTALALPVDTEKAYGLAMQTTLSVADAAAIVAALQERFPDLHGPASDDICYATTNRQHAVRLLAPRCDAFLVLGGYNSSNSRRLAEVAEAAGCPRVRLLERPEELPMAWLDGVRILGLSSGASTPETAMEALIAWLRDGFDVGLEELRAADESIRFGLPALPPHARGGAGPRGRAP
ncbi:MAG TPA: 4-hydroxy-3-methylbut-2-enyl diphosphate reductase [Acetobacteraceae bacterium]|nr:4-hydroxy-3-methylbut-2-enyl diphosphate reductase [Acetobacteraceae bacterium]